MSTGEAKQLPFSETEIRLLELFSRLRPALSDYEAQTSTLPRVEIRLQDSTSYVWNGEEFKETTADWEMSDENVWLPFLPSNPLPSSDSLLLVTNNLNAKTISGSMSHIWLVRGVFRVPSGEVQAVAEGIRLKKLTHYRKVVV